MNTIQKRIIREISMRNTYEAALKSLRFKQCAGDPPSDNMNALQARIDAIDVWLSFIPAPQAFVLKRHLVDGLDWMQMRQEFSDRWGDDCARHERTLKRYQQKAIRTIEAFVVLHTASYAYLLNENDDT